MSEAARSLTIDVVICTYTDDRWSDLCAAVASVAAQTRSAASTIVVVDHNPGLFERALLGFRDVTVIQNADLQGLSGARNTGLAAATADIVAFLDDDARADAGWLENLARWYVDPRVLGAGGAVDPTWDGGRPAVFPEEFDWVVGCSYRGMPDTASPVRNPLGANMSFRRTVLSEVGGFRNGIGRIGTLPLGCEETELSIRVRTEAPGSVLMYDPEARVRHRVPAARGRWRYFRRRCWAEGRSKAVVSDLVGARDGLSSERAHALRTLPRGVAKGVADSVIRHDPAGLGRSLAIVIGFFLTVTGYVVGRTLLRMRPAASATRGAGPINPSLAFNVHGIVGIEVEADAPTAALLAEMLDAFRVDSVKKAHLVVSASAEPLVHPAAAEHAYRYTADAIELPQAQIRFDADRVTVGGKGELLTTIIPLLDRLVVERGAGMIHAATLAYRGQGVCIGAWGGAGKTSTVAKFVSLEGGAFMGDDWAFLTADGRLLGYAKPMFMKAHHRAIYPTLFSQKRKPLVPPGVLPLVNRLATAVHPLITRHPRLAGLTRRWSPEHWVVSPKRVFAPERIETSAPLTVVVFLERYAGDEVRHVEQSVGWMAARLVSNFHAELPRQSQEVLVALANASIVGLGRSFGDKTAVLEAALQDVPCFLLQVPERLGADAASDAIVAAVLSLLPGSDGVDR